jgi:ABC-2 type transport system permease protein
VLSGLIIAVGIQFVNTGGQKISAASDLRALVPVADVLRWVPPGSTMDAVRAASSGSYGVMVAELGYTLVWWALLLLWWWQRSLTRLMTAPDSSTLPAAAQPDRARDQRAGLAGVLPAGRTGAVMLRSEPLRVRWRLMCLERMETCQHPGRYGDRA